MNKATCQRSHGLRFESGTAANRAVFKAQSHADWTQSSQCGLVAYFNIIRLGLLVALFLYNIESKRKLGRPKAAFGNRLKKARGKAKAAWDVMIISVELLAGLICTICLDKGGDPPKAGLI